MYAKTIALNAARTQARHEANVWWALCWNHAKTEDERARAKSMAECWELVAMHIDRQIKHRGDVLVTRPDIKAVAEALVTHKSEVAYKVDHG